jgi:hypothetical protein
MRLLRYWLRLTSTYFHFGSSRRRSRRARWLATWPSSVILRGHLGKLVERALRKNACAAAMSRSGRSRKSTAVLIDSAIKIIPLAQNFYISFVHAPGSIHRPCEAVPSLLELRHISTQPKNRRVRHDNAALGHHRLEIPIAQSVGDVPAHAQLDDLGIEPATSVNGISNNWLGHSAPRGRRNCTVLLFNATEPWWGELAEPFKVLRPQFVPRRYFPQFVLHAADSELSAPSDRSFHYNRLQGSKTPPGERFR